MTKKITKVGPVAVSRGHKDIVGSASPEWQGALRNYSEEELGEVLTHETDRGKVIAAACIMDDILKHILESWHIADERDISKARDFYGRIEMYYPAKSGPPLILNKGFHAVRELRNRCAHKFTHFDFDELTKKEMQWLEDFSMAEAVLFHVMGGGRRESSIRDQFIADAVKVINVMNVNSHNYRRDSLSEG